MKKIFFLMMTVFLLTSMGYAQQSLNQNDEKLQPVLKDGTIEIDGQTITIDRSKLAPGYSCEPNTNPKQTRATFFFEDFNATTFPPTGWDRIHYNGTSQNGNWARSTASPTWDGGYAYRADVSGTNPQYSILITPLLSIPEGQKLTFMSSIKDPVYYAYSWVCVSPVKGAQEFIDNIIYEIDGADVSESWREINVSLGDFAGQDVYIAFMYYGAYSHGWRIDDVEIKDFEGNDLVLTRPNFTYTQIPVSQTLLPAISARVENFGVTQTNVQLSVDYNGTEFTSAVLPSLGAGASTTMSVNTGSPAIPLGPSTLMFNVTQEEEDDNPSNNSFTLNFTGTEDTFAVDETVLPTANGVGYTTANYRLGNLFTLTEPIKLRQVRVGFNTNALTVAFNLQLFARTGNNIAATPLFSIPSTRPAGGGWVDVNIPQTTIPPGDYFLCVQQTTASNPLVAYDGVSTRYCYGVTTSTELYEQTGFGSLAIRMITAVPCNILTAPTNLTAVPGLMSATLSWSGDAPTYKVTVNNGTTDAIYYTDNTTLTVSDLQTIPHTWSVAVVCDDEDNAPTTTGTAFTPLSCTVYTFPFAESFDDATFPPVCWTSQTSTNTPWKRVTTGTSPTCSTHSGAGMLQFNSYSSPYTSGTKGLIITPPLDAQGANLKVLFWMFRDNGYTTYTNEVVNVYVNNETSLTGATLLLTIPRTRALAPVEAADGWYEYFASLPTASGERYVIFEGVSQFGNNMYVDDISVVKVVDHDMEAISISGVENPGAFTTNTYTVTVRNCGVLPSASSYVVKVMTEDNEVLAQQTVTGVLAPNATNAVAFELMFPQTMAGPLKIKGRVEMTGDEQSTNDETPLLAIDIIPHPGYELDCHIEAPITTGTVATYYTLPLNNLYNRSYTEQIYDAAEIGFEPGTIINSIAFLPTHSTSNVYSKSDQSIYLANTSKSTFSNATDHIPAGDLQLVFSPKTIVFNHNVNPTWQTLEFDVPFVYTGGNIAVVYVNNHGAYASANTFRTGTVTGKAIGVYTDATTVISPTNIPTSTTATYAYRNHVKFVACDKLYTLHPDNLGDPMFTLIPDAIPEGENGTVYFNMEDGACIFDVLFDGVSQGYDAQWGRKFEFKNVTEPLPFIEIVLVFGQSYEVNATSGPNGTISPIGTTTLCHSESQLYLLMPDHGYIVSELFIDDVSVTVPSNNRYTFTNVSEPHTIHVTYEPCPTNDVHFTVEGSGVINYENFEYDGNGTIVICKGSNPEFDFIPDFGYEIQGVYIDGVLNMFATGGHYMFINLNQDHTIKAVFKPIDYTIYASAGANGTIAPSGNVSVPYGTSKLFTFIPNTGYVIDQVFVDNVENTDAAVDGYYNFEDVAENHSIYVTYKKATLYITVTSNLENGAYPIGVVPVLYNEIISFTFIPEEGYHVAMVYVDGDPYPQGVQTGSYTFFYVTENHTLHIAYELYTYPITAQADDHSMIAPAGTTYVDHFDQQHYTFYALQGYEITNVFVDGHANAAALANGAYTFTNVSAPHTIDVVTAPITYTITAMAGEGGFITPRGDISVTFGNNQYFTFAAANGYELDKVLIDGNNIIEAAQNGSYSFIDVREDHTISVTFKILRFTVAALSAPNGAIEPAGITELDFGTDVTYTITPDEGYKISFVLVNGDNMGEIDSYTFAAVEADGTIEAFFSLIPTEPTGIIDPTLEGINIYSYTNIVYIVNENNLPISDVSIFDMYGRTVWQGKPQGNQIVLDVANGIYTVRVTADENFTATKVNIQR